ncbi:MAG: hypothetical protein WBP11_01790 [Dokdonella sp.]
MNRSPINIGRDQAAAFGWSLAMPTPSPESAAASIKRIVDFIEQGTDKRTIAVAQAARNHFPNAAILARLDGIAVLRLERHDNSFAALTQAPALVPRDGGTAPKRQSAD